MTRAMSNAVAIALIAAVFLLILITVGVSLWIGFSARQWGAILIGIILLALLSYNIWRLVQRGYQMRQLALDGVASIAYVEDKRSFRSKGGGKRYFLTYRYTLPDGHTFQHTPALTGRRWSSLQVGDTVRIVYLPQRPQVSALEEDVAPVRQALQSAKK
jgi:hypothetical protein